MNKSWFSTFKICFATILRGVMVLAVGVIPPSISLILGRPISEAILTLICLVLMIFLTRIELIEQISIGPMSARLHKKLVEAEEILQKVREVTLLISEISLSTMIRSGKLGGFSEEEEELHRTRIVALLRGLKIDESKIMAAQRELLVFLKRDYQNCLLGQTNPPAGIPEERAIAWNDLVTQKRLATLGEIRSFLKSINAIDEDSREWLEDYDHFIQTGEHRRPDVFKECRNRSRLIIANSGVEL